MYFCIVTPFAGVRVDALLLAYVPLVALGGALIDFGINPDLTLDGLPALNELRELCQHAAPVPVPAVEADGQDSLPWIG